MNAAEIISIINASPLTIEDLLHIQNVVREARQDLRTEAGKVIKYQYGVGTYVKTFGLAPKYLNGLTGKITAIRNKRCDLDMDVPLIKRYAFNGNRLNGCPLSNLKVIGATPITSETLAIKPAALMNFVENK